MAIHHGMAIASWGVLGHGKFQTPAQILKRQEPLRGALKQSDQEVAMSKALSEVAKAHGIESVTAIALAYVRAKAPNVLPLIGGRKIEHWMDNITGLEIGLTKEEIRFLESKNEFDLGFPASFVGQDWRVTGEASALFAASGPVNLRA